MQKVGSWSRACAGFLAVLLSGCGHVPLTTIARLRSFDAATVDPAQLRIAIRAPDWIEPRTGEAALVLKLAGRDGATAREERYILDPAESPAEASRVARHAHAGERIWPWRIATAELARVRAFQEEGRRLAAQGANRLSLGAAIEACRRGEAPAGAIRTTTLIQPDAETGYLVLLDGVDLPETAASAAGVDLDAKLPPCGKAALRAQ